VRTFIVNLLCAGKTRRVVDGSHCLNEEREYISVEVVSCEAPNYKVIHRKAFISSFTVMAFCDL
jgi:hypothetical protein